VDGRAGAGQTGTPGHQRGLTGWPGLCFPGLTWQHTRGSALLGWVKGDDAYIAHQIDVGG
jgi:putative flavoprotein involved in K+ transport